MHTYKTHMYKKGCVAMHQTRPHGILCKELEETKTRQFLYSLKCKQVVGVTEYKRRLRVWTSRTLARVSLF